MDVFNLKASISIDTSGFSQKVGEAKSGFAGIAAAADTSKKSANQYNKDVMKLANTFRKAGMSMSDALKKAHESIDRSLYDIGESAKKAGDEVKSAGDSFQKSKSKIAGMKPSLGALPGLFRSAGDSAGFFKDKITALDVAIGNWIASGVSRIASGLKSVVSSMVETSATVQAENAQFEATFGAAADVAQEAFDRVGESTNILSSRLRTVGTKAFAQFTGAGIDTAESMESMERYTNLAADAAAYYDISLEDADERLRSFLRGNTEAGDMIGLFTSESQRNTYAMEKYGASWQNLTEAQKQMLMLDVAEDIYKQSGAMGQASREGDAYENTMGNFKETIKQTLGVLGAPIQVAFTDFIAKITDFLNDEGLQDSLEKFSFYLGGIAEQTFSGVIDFFKGLTSEENIAKIKSVADSVKELGGDLLSLASSDLGKGITATAIVAIIAKKHPLLAGALLIGTPFVAQYSDIKESAKEGAGILSSTVSEITEDPVGYTKKVTEYGSLSDMLNNLQTSQDAFYGDEPPESYSEGTGKIVDAWGDVKTSVDDATTAVMTFWKVNNYPGSYGGMFTGGSGGISYVAFDDTTGGPGGLRGYATGLPNVPYNNFVARLHEGERVLTKSENAAYSGKAQSTESGPSNIAGSIADAVAYAIGRMKVVMNGQIVGDVVTDTVSRNIAREAYSGRFAR